MKPLRSKSVALVLCAACSLAFGATSSSVIYRCPGNVISNELNPRQAKELGCETLAMANVTVLPAQTVPALPTAPASAASVAPRRVATPAAASGSATVKVPASEQRSRDSDAVNILSLELKREQVKLADLRQRPADASIAAAMARSVADIAALERELARHPAKPLR